MCGQEIRSPRIAWRVPDVAQRLLVVDPSTTERDLIIQATAAVSRLARTLKAGQRESAPE
jgi:hypothetical protein